VCIILARKYYRSLPAPIDRLNRPTVALESNSTRRAMERTLPNPKLERTGLSGSQSDGVRLVLPSHTARRPSARRNSAFTALWPYAQNGEVGGRVGACWPSAQLNDGESRTPARWPSAQLKYGESRSLALCTAERWERGNRTATLNA
jgi:hypothetical protein